MHAVLELVVHSACLHAEDLVRAGAACGRHRVAADRDELEFVVEGFALSVARPRSESAPRSHTAAVRRRCGRRCPRTMRAEPDRADGLFRRQRRVPALRGGDWAMGANAGARGQGRGGPETASMGDGEGKRARLCKTVAGSAQSTGT